MSSAIDGRTPEATSAEIGFLGCKEDVLSGIADIKSWGLCLSTRNSSGVALYTVVNIGISLTRFNRIGYGATVHVGRCVRILLIISSQVVKNK